MAEAKTTIVVDAKDFDAFLQTFSKYQAGFKEQPAAWGKVADASAKAHENFAEMGGVALALAEGLDDGVRRTRDLGRETARVADRWSKLATHTRSAAGHIKDATTSLLKWAGITGLIAGVAGFGAEHAIFDFASSVSARRSTALGYGTTYGGLASARVNYARFGDADTALGNIAAAQSDPSKRLGLQNLHVDGSPGRDATEVLADAMKSVKDLLDRKPAGVGLKQFSDNMHLDDVFSLSDLQRIQHSSREEVRGQADRMLADRRGLDLAPDVQKKWQDLTTQLTKAGTAIETVLVNRLAALEPGLDRLSEAFTKAATTLLAKDGPVTQWLGELDKGLEWLATKLDDPNTQKNLSDFLTQVGQAAEYVWGAGKKALELLHWLAKLTGDDPSSASATSSTGGITPLAGGSGIDLSGRRNPMGGGGATGLRGGGRRPSMGGRRGVVGQHGGAGSRGGWWTEERVRHAYDKLVAGGLSPVEAEAQIARMAYVEAGAGPTASQGGGAHYGIYQADPQRQRNFGGSDDFDAQLDAIIKEKNTSEAASHRAGLAAKDDRAGAVAASMFERGEGYNPSTGEDAWVNKTVANMPAIHRIVTRRPQTPQAPAPAAPTARPAAPPAKVTVSRATGANPVTSTAAAAAPQ